MDEHLSDLEKAMENSQPMVMTSSSAILPSNSTNCTVSNIVSSGRITTVSGKIKKHSDKTSTNTSRVSIQICQRRPVTRSQTGSLPLRTEKLDAAEVEKTCSTLCDLKQNTAYTPKSARSKHYLTTGHAITGNDFGIVLRETHLYKLLVKESLVIRAIAPSLNGTDRSVSLYVYSNGIQQALWDRRNIECKGSGL
ncbi:unnamed protein product [Didymodactylos carnosus]|uniref:Uncharacterized protein n=1 Tax=Didymodactylos carnosus TaxID=1234261 RepID=A0A815RYA8_9BILA|nr:unnamed protein product [Didymodactylos carnosus]CAF4347123.1 unnamed protein product [Didymodactylos carnosus]